MSSRPLWVLSVIAATAGPSRAAGPLDPTPPPLPTPEAIASPPPRPRRVTPQPPPRPTGITADQLRARPLLSHDGRAAMRLACEARTATCDPLALLGHLERAALVQALDQRGLAVDPAPAGKRIGRVHVVTNPPFGEDARILRWANVFHVASKERIVAREVLLHPGDVYDVDRLDETQRKLRDPLFTTLAVVVPVVTPDARTVDLLVVTRDIFSLRANTNYEFQGGEFTFLTLSLSENNFLGRRMLVAAVFLMDHVTVKLYPLFIDKNFLGKQLEVHGHGGPLINRDTFALEGSESDFSLSRPLWSLSSRWGWTLEASHRFSIERSYRGADLRTFDAPSTPEVEHIPYRFDERFWSAGASVVRQSGGADLKHQFSVGYKLTSQRPTVSADFMASDAARADFIAAVLPRNERTGVVFAGYQVFTPRYREYRDIDSYDLAEDNRLGPTASVTLGAGLRALASDKNFATLALDGGWTSAWGHDGLLGTGASFSARLDADGSLVDRAVGLSGRVSSPSLPAGRLVSELRLTGVFRDESNRFLYLGGDSGLRAYPLNFIDGDRRAVLQTELRSKSVRLILGSRWGVLLFHDIGGAADRLADFRFYQDIGIGIRALNPQLSPEVFRFDLGFPLTSYDIAGAHHGLWPPRVTAGYKQAF